MHRSSNISDKILIIGSGIGGLSTAIILAKLGYDVTVIEKNKHPGGMSRSFVRHGVHCNVGVHYMGALADGQVLRRCFDYLGITEQLSLTRMGVDGPVDRYHFKDSRLDVDTFDLVDGFDAYKEHLNAAFPKQKNQVRALMDMIDLSARHLDRLDFLYADQPSTFWIDQTEALGTIFDELDCSPGLRAVFGMPSVFIGVPPAMCPQFFHAMTLASYLFSAWRMDHRGEPLADVCTHRLAALGGQLHTGQAVERIHVQNGRVVGVSLASGERIAADTIVAAIHPKTTMGLIAPQHVKTSYRRRIQGLADTDSMVGIHALVPADSHPVIPHNLFSIETEPNGAIRDLIYLQLRPSGQPERNLLTLLTSGHDSLWQAWEHTQTGRRGPDYLATKNQFAKQIAAGMAPITGSFDRLQIIDVYTPLTFRDWSASPAGSAYGVMRSTDQLMSAALLNRTSLKGLYLAGQSVLAPGILGTILGSLTTVQFIIGPERFRKAVRV